MHVEISIDIHTREATFRRSIHPMHLGDLDLARERLDKVYREARQWLEENHHPHQDH